MTHALPPLTRDRLIGRVASYFLHERVDDTSDGTARFIIDRLSATQTAAIARAILQDPDLASRFEIRLPRWYVGQQNLPEDILTEQRATYFRNAAVEKPALLLANVGDDEEQSLRDLSAVGAPDLLGRPDLWVSVASTGVPITDDQRRWWETALNALQDLRFVSLDRYADYVLRVREQVLDNGLLIEALGAALPALLMPRRTHAFNEVPEKLRGRTAKYKKVYTSTYEKSACYLSKRKPDGTLLSDEELRAAFAKVSEDIPEEHHALIERFLEADAGWTDVSDALAECEWEDIKPLFDGLQRQKFNLAASTLAFYDDGDPDQINRDEREYLNRLQERRTTQPEEDDVKFYERHRDELREDRKLKSYWEKFVYGNPKETTDFLAGFMAALESFDWETGGLPVRSRRLRITADKRSKRDLKELNRDAGLFFAMRYRGLPGLLGQDVEWDTGSLMDFDRLVQEWKGRREDANKSEKKTALQIKFTLHLEVTTLNGAIEPYQNRFIWQYNPLAIQSELPNDWNRLVLHPFQECQADREPTSSKGRSQSVDLRDVKTLVASFGYQRGSLVSKYLTDRDLSLRWQKNLVESKERGWITESTATSVAELFTNFQTAYGAAIRAVAEVGLSSPLLEKQAEAYADLIEGICAQAPGDRNRSLLLRPLLALGTVPVRGGHLTAIVAPWHPLRLASLARKARRFSGVVRQLLSPTTTAIGDTRLFFRDKQEELAHPFSPEVTLVFQREQPALVSLTDTLGDYTLHESPLVSEQGRDETNDNPAEGAERVKELVGRYLTLQPHERNNLSVVLYNCDSARLPTAVVGKLSALNQDEADARCQVILRHRDPKRLRTLYEQIVESTDDRQDSYVSSEATRDFMARLRIGIMADQAPPADPKDGRPEDIVFLQDVIARHAQLAWYPVSGRAAHPEALNPAQWSRRRPMAPADMKSVVYLTCPVQTRDGWAYLTAVASFLTGQWNAPEDTRYIPARQLDFRDPEASRILEETHNLGSWVANHDELLDRRQLSEQGVQIIRYKQTGTTGRSLVISSTAPLGLLKSMVRRRLHDLDLEIPDEELQDLTRRFVDDANEVSGDIVLRAAKRGRSASELMGLVLSRYLIRHELGPEAPIGWYFLDDYATWLGQREEQIADLLALCPRVNASGDKELVVIVTEAKYIDASGLVSKRKESAKQLADTLKRISGAVVDTAPRMDREVWLSRIADLLVDGVRSGSNTWLDLAEWARAVRDGECPIILRGYSHVFVSGPASEPVVSGAAPLSQVGDLTSLQEIFSLDDVKRLVRAYAQQQSPVSHRESASGTGGHGLPWRSDKAKKKPTPPVGETAVQEPAEETAEPKVPVLPPPPQTQVANGPSERRTWAYPSIGAWVQEASSTLEESPEAVEWLDKVAMTTRLALQQFNLQAKLLSSTLTPNAALLKFQGSAQLTVEQALKRRGEFLTTYGLFVIGVQPQPGAVVIAVAREKRQSVPLRSLWKRWSPDSSAGNQTLLIGVRETDGSLLLLSPGQEHAPHTLIAGSTGSGKSVLMQNIILSIAATNTPQLARITLIDPKQGVDYFAFEDLPHLEGGIIDQQEKALIRIEELVAEMDARYTRFKAARVPNLTAYNAKVSPEERMPVLWLIHDEFAEWMLVDEYKTQVTAAVGRLGVKARAAGIYLVFAAQRPEANVMPMQLRANLGNRLILRVDSEGTSEIALGEKGADRLLGRGHLLAKLDGEMGLIYAQVPFATPNEISEVVENLETVPAESEIKTDSRDQSAVTGITSPAHNVDGTAGMQDAAQGAIPSHGVAQEMVVHRQGPIVPDDLTHDEIQAFIVFSDALKRRYGVELAALRTAPDAVDVYVTNPQNWFARIVLNREGRRHIVLRATPDVVRQLLPKAIVYNAPTGSRIYVEMNDGLQDIGDAVTSIYRLIVSESAD